MNRNACISLQEFIANAAHDPFILISSVTRRGLLTILTYGAT